MTTRPLLATCITLLYFIFPGGAVAQDSALRCGSLFTDHMVLQRDQSNPIWGEAAPGVELRVGLNADFQTTTTAADGKWRLELPPLEAGGPHILSISDGQTTLTCTDVLVGEVWLASGQSNMNWEIARSENPQREIAAANYPKLRLYTVPRTPSFDTLDYVAGDPTWAPCTPDTASSFSAVAYYFGRDLHKSLDVPVGLIHTSVGGTRAELWISPAGVRNFPEFQTEAERLEKDIADRAGTRARYVAQLKTWHAELEKLDQTTTAGWWQPDYVDDAWEETQVPGLWAGTELEDFDGTVRYRREFTLKEVDEASSYVLRLGRIDDADTTWLNGELIDSTDDAGVRRAYDVPAPILRQGRNVLAVRVLDTGSDGGFVGPKNQLALGRRGADRQTTTAAQLSGKWKFQRGVPLAAEVSRTGLPPRPADPLPQYHLASLYKGMVAPLVPYGIRGFIWYQGESNSQKAEQYKRLFPHLIQDWRRVWGEKELPFYYVQLAGYLKDPQEPAESAWAELREAQLETLKLRNTGMAVAIDIGDENDIHPRNKKDVGERLARIARARVYGEEVEYSGPVPKDWQREGGKLVVQFQHADGLKAKGGELKGFAIAGEDRTFKWAKARIEGERVEVSHSDIAEPAAVRYNWGNTPDGNLYNGADLPATPFRTDNWKREEQ